MSTARAGTPAVVDGAQCAREMAEVVRVGLLAPWGCTAPGYRALRWLLGPKQGTLAEPCRTPVVLVHGYGGNRTHWLPLEGALRQAGFVNVHPAAYHSARTTLGGLARALEISCHEAMEAAGSDHLHLIGHSLGGVLVRYVVQRLGLAADVRTAVTVAAPHRGTSLARLGWDPVARALRPGSPLLQALAHDASAGNVQWVTYYSDGDLVVRPGSAQLDQPGLHALNVPVPHVGHLGILRAPELLRSVPGLLLAAERPTAMRTGATTRTGTPVPIAA